jgi:hypothetical protein
MMYGMHFEFLSTSLLAAISAVEGVLVDGAASLGAASLSAKLPVSVSPPSPVPGDGNV